MKVIYFPDQKVDIKGCPVATIGSFDGLHLGHQEIIKKTVAAAQQKNEPSLVITFDQHPRAFLRPHEPLGLLTTLDEKVKLIEQFAVDYLLILRFAQIAKLTAEQFCSYILHQQAKVCQLFVGENFRFGSQAKGTTSTLVNCGLKLGFTVEVVPLKRIDDNSVSSSLIRELLKKGEVEKVKSLLGRYPQLSGKVVEGDKRGKLLGFPTANIQAKSQLCLPKAGIYIGYTIVNEKKHPSVINCGFKPTFGRHPFQCETHIFNFNQNLYGQEITVQFLKFIRTEQKFSAVEKLVEQIKKDVEAAKAFFDRGII